MFLKKVEGSLGRLSLANSFPKLNMENLNCFNFLKMESLDELNLKNVGLISILKIHECFPNVSILDLSNNRVFSIECIEVLHKLENLAEVSFKENPVCVHKHLREMVLDVVPNIEVVNSETLKEAGSRYKEELQKLRGKIDGLGDRTLIEAAEEDPAIRKKLFEDDK